MKSLLYNFLCPERIFKMQHNTKEILHFFVLILIFTVAKTTDVVKGIFEVEILPKLYINGTGQKGEKVCRCLCLKDLCTR